MSCTTANDSCECRLWVLVLSVMLCCAAGCGDASVQSVADAYTPKEFTYICSKTGEQQRGPMRSWPYDNPSSPCSKFMLSLYCKKCGRWYAVPPPDKSRGNPLAYPCPKTGGELSVTGPEKPLAASRG